MSTSELPPNELPPSKGSAIGNFLKAILLVVIAIVIIRLFFSVLHWIFGMIVAGVVVLVIGALIFGVVSAFRRRS